jgi:hypothetical protein
MGYLVEKQVFSGFAYHYMNVVDNWEIKEDKLSIEDAKKSAIEHANNIEKGKYRVRDIYSGNVLFEVSS